VYRLQGREYQYKHIEVIVRPMLRPRRVPILGARTSYITGEQSEKATSWRRTRSGKRGKKPASLPLHALGTPRRPLRHRFVHVHLRGLVQETTPVLTEGGDHGQARRLRVAEGNVIVGRLIPAAPRAWRTTSRKDQAADPPCWTSRRGSAASPAAEATAEAPDQR